MRFRLVVDGEAHELEIEGSRPAWTVKVDGAVYRARVESAGGGLRVRIGSRRHRVQILGSDVLVDGRPHRVLADRIDEEPSGIPAVAGAGRRRLEIRPPMPGRVVRLDVVPGSVVRRGQVLAVLEAMKMQNEIPAPSDGLVTSVHVREGESITTDRVIAILETR